MCSICFSLDQMSIILEEGRFEIWSYHHGGAGRWHCSNLKLWTERFENQWNWIFWSQSFIRYIYFSSNLKSSHLEAKSLIHLFSLAVSVWVLRKSCVLLMPSSLTELRRGSQKERRMNETMDIMMSDCSVQRMIPFPSQYLITPWSWLVGLSLSPVLI